VKPAAAPKSSAACPGRPAASPCYGPCWTAPPAAGRGVNTTPDGLRLVHDLRRCLLEPPPQIHPRTPAADSAAENVRATA